MQFTKSQLAALETRGKTILVSAAAGSGKTFTLTTRIINAIIGDGENGDDLQRKLVVTFTRAAAGELREKIFKKLSDAIAADPSNSRLQDQLVRLGSAKISTIDSFLLDPIKNNFERLGLPAQIRLADDAELQELHDRIMQNVLDEMYEKYSVCKDGRLEAPSFVSDYTDLIDILTSARDSSALIPTLYSLYTRLIASEDGVQRLRFFSERLAAQASLDFFQTVEGQIIQEHILSLLGEHTPTILDTCAELISTQGDLSALYAPLLENYKSIMLTLEAATHKGYKEAASAFADIKFPSAPRIKSDMHTTESLYIKDKALKKLRESIKGILSEYLFESQSEISLEYQKSASLCSVLYKILQRFDELYMAEKVRIGILEFSDMPRYMLRLLQDPDGTPSDIAQGLASSFTEVYIDEYQDVNEIQDKIFQLIGGNRRFMVGDIKQSIYGFRDADPSIFASYRQRLPLHDSPEADEAEGCSIFMSNNFRCDKSIIDFTNLVCAPIFSASGDSMGYTKNDDLVFSKGDKDGGFPIILNLIQKPPRDDAEELSSTTEDIDGDESDESQDDEAIIVANEILMLLQHGLNSDGKRVHPSDIAILVRTKNIAKPLTDALGALGIPYSTSSKSDLFESSEMKLLLNLLEVIDNPRGDTPLFGLLSCPECSLFTLEEIITVRRACEGSKSLYDALLTYGMTNGDDRPITPLSLRCRDFCEKCEKLRLYSMKVSADKLLRALASDGDLSPICQGEAFTYIYDSARRRTRTSYEGLYSFIDYLKRLIEKGNATSAESDGGATDAIKIMTTHQSKGLEFNICFLYGLGKAFNLADSKESLIFDRNIAVGLKIPVREEDSFYESAYPSKKNTMIRRALSLAINRKQIEEEMRIFYVALTRARERIYLSAKLKTSFDDAMLNSRIWGSSAHELRSTKNYIFWVLSALHRGGNDIQINITNKGASRLCEHPASILGTEILDTDDIRNAEYARLAECPISVSEIDKKISLIPSKVAASRVAPDMLDRAIFIPLTASESIDKEGGELQSQTEKSVRYRIELMRSAQPDFASVIDENRRPTASERGTAIHEFLQFCDYESVYTIGYEGELERLVALGFMSERSARIINRRHLEAFTRSDLFSLVRNAKNVRREFRFGSFVPASEFTLDAEMKNALSDKKIYIQGSIDLMIEGDDGSIILCDYKSDKLTDEEASSYEVLCRVMNERHSEQLREYCRAIEHIFGRVPNNIYIYSFSAGRLVEIK